MSRAQSCVCLNMLGSLSVVCGVLFFASSSLEARTENFVTSVRADCTGNTSGQAHIALIGAENQVSHQNVACENGGVTTTDVTTAYEPIAWQIGASATGVDRRTGNQVNVLCVEEAATRFPAVYTCNSGSHVNLYVMAFRPRPAE